MVSYWVPLCTFSFLFPSFKLVLEIFAIQFQQTSWKLFGNFIFLWILSGNKVPNKPIRKHIAFEFPCIPSQDIFKITKKKDKTSNISWNIKERNSCRKKKKTRKKIFAGINLKLDINSHLIIIIVITVKSVLKLSSIGWSLSCKSSSRKLISYRIIQLLD